MANNNNTSVKSEQPKKKRSIGRWFKELFSELKKVSWPTFPKVVKQTGVVILVTLCFLLILMAMDAGLGQLYKLLIRGLQAEMVSANAIGGILSGVGQNIMSSAQTLFSIL